ncbi:MAG: VWA domain-containing protein [Phycisphaerales bacterium]
MMRFSDPVWLHALWTVPVVLAILFHSIGVRRRNLRRFVGSDLESEMAPRWSAARLVTKSLLIGAALTLIVLSLARPQWGVREEEIETYGRDVCFVIDVSRSMLADDLAPSRLERTKIWITDTLSILRGDRVGLIAFAGAPVVKCPLTHDYAFFRLALEELSPESVSRGGTLIGDAIRTAVDEVFAGDEARHQDIILITDGEDHESFPVEAAAAAGAAGIRIIAIGLGDAEDGTPIYLVDPETGERSPLRHEGEIVRSRLDSDTLLGMAQASDDGVYLEVSTGTIELDRVYEELIRRAEQSAMDARSTTMHEDRYQFILAAALILLVIEGLLREER